MATVREAAMNRWVNALKGEDDTKKNKKLVEETGSSLDVILVDGPRQGDRLRLVNPPPQKLRLIVHGTSTEWATYERREGSNEYSYIGDVRLGNKIQIGSYSSAG